MTIFRVVLVYGQECRTPISLSTSNTRFESINNMIKEMNEIRKSIKLTMKSAQDRAKHYANNKRVFGKFEVGDKVFLKVVLKQSRLKLGKSRKSSPRFCGSFEIVKRIGLVAYKLKLPDDWQIQYVFYVSLLRKYVYDPNHSFLELPKAAFEGKFLTEREKILKMDIQHLWY